MGEYKSSYKYGAQISCQLDGDLFHQQSCLAKQSAGMSFPIYAQSSVSHSIGRSLLQLTAMEEIFHTPGLSFLT